MSFAKFCWKLCFQPLRTIRCLWRAVAGRGYKVIFYMKSGNKIAVDLSEWSMKGSLHSDSKSLNWSVAPLAKQILKTIDITQIEAIIMDD